MLFMVFEFNLLDLFWGMHLSFVCLLRNRTKSFYFFLGPLYCS